MAEEKQFHKCRFGRPITDLDVHYMSFDFIVAIFRSPRVCPDCAPYKLLSLHVHCIWPLFLCYDSAPNSHIYIFISCAVLFALQITIVMNNAFCGNSFYLDEENWQRGDGRDNLTLI